MYNTTNDFSESINNNKSLHELSNPQPKHAFMAFSLVLLLLVYVASYFQRKNFISGVIITEFGIVLSIPILFGKYLNFDFASMFRFNKVSFANLSLGVGILIFSLPLIGIINLIFTSIMMKIFGRIDLDNIPVAQSIPELLLFFLLIGGTAGLCEEILFRGFILRSLEHFGGKSALLISSILFGVMHLKLEKLPATIILGLIIGFAVYRTNSIFTGMVMHFTNNSLATLLSFIYEKISGTSINKASNSYIATPELLNGSMTEKIFLFITLTSFIITIIATCATILFFLTKKLIKNTPQNSFTKGASLRASTLKDYAWLSPSAVLILLISIKQVSGLLNYSSGLLERITNFIFPYN